MSGTVIVIVGGQHGSEGKGHVAAKLAWDREHVVAVRVAGPNAGHSAIGIIDGQKWALRQIPVMAVTNLEATLVIGAGSEIDRDVLIDEIDQLDAAGYAVLPRLFIDPSATVIEPRHQEIEATMGADGRSTGKGIGAARADRLLRRAGLWGGDDLPTERLLRRRLNEGWTVIIEGTQGYGLGQHAGFYPDCTSSDCRAIDFLAMAGISPWDPAVRDVRTWVVLRTYPIRIAGNSGPLLAETSWGDLGAATEGYIRPEYTTVTKKVRRVGCWDPDLARAAVAANGGANAVVALTFFDYWYPDLAGAERMRDLGTEHRVRVTEIEEDIGAQVAYLGTGPNSGVFL